DIVNVRTFRYKFIFTHAGSDEALVSVHIKFGISKGNLGGFDLIENSNFCLTFPPLTILVTKVFKPVNGQLGQVSWIPLDYFYIIFLRLHLLVSFLHVKAGNTTHRFIDKLLIILRCNRAIKLIKERLKKTI